jgi:hypothetical protein
MLSEINITASDFGALNADYGNFFVMALILRKRVVRRAADVLTLETTDAWGGFPSLGHLSWARNS